jgi:hypothetical protein
VYYEKDLKFSLREYVQRDDVQREREQIQRFHSIDEIIHFIKKTHKEYLKALKVVHEDVQYIIDLCYKVVDAILMFFEIAIKKLHNVHTKNKLLVEYSQS